MKAILHTGLWTAAVLLYLVAAAAAPAQSFEERQAQLEERQENARSTIESLREEIENFESRISEAQDEYSRLYQRYQELEREVNMRDAILDNLHEERTSIEEEIRITEQNIEQLSSDLDELIENYKQTLRYVYKHGRTPEAAMVLTAGSINQMLVRAYYLQRFEEQRQRQARQIERTREELRDQRENLQQNRERNQDLIAETRQEQQTLQARRTEQEQNIAELQRDRERLRERKEQHQSEIEEMETIMTELIEEEERLLELERERRRRAAEAERIRNPGGNVETASHTDAGSSPGLPGEERLNEIEASFRDAQGAISWPVNNGTVTTPFGRRVNPLYGTETNQPGIEISAEPASDVHAVHDGYVFAIRPIPGFGDCVFVSHGRYKTVYGNLSDVDVELNTTLSEGDVIGQSGTSSSLNGATLFFMVRDGEQNVDPEQWLADN